MYNINEKAAEIILDYITDYVNKKWIKIVMDWKYIPKKEYKEYLLVDMYHATMLWYTKDLQGLNKKNCIKKLAMRANNDVENNMKLALSKCSWNNKEIRINYWSDLLFIFLTIYLKKDDYYQVSLAEYLTAEKECWGDWDCIVKKLQDEWYSIKKIEEAKQKIEKWIISLSF